MKDYRDVWVVLRIDGPAQGYTDYISVKGVYGSQADAQAAADRAAEVNPPFETQYHIFKKKQLISGQDRETQEGAPARIQGLSPHALEAARIPTANHRWLSQLTELAESIPPEARSRAFAPLVGYLAEHLVARALHGHINSDPKLHSDIILDDGRTVDVKAVVLAHDAKKAPFIMVEPRMAELVALVLFTPELDVASGFLFPMSLIARYSRGAGNREGKIGVRVTSDLLASPGVEPLRLPNADINPPVG